MAVAAWISSPTNPPSHCEDQLSLPMLTGCIRICPSFGWMYPGFLFDA